LHHPSIGPLQNVEGNKDKFSHVYLFLHLYYYYYVRFHWYNQTEAIGIGKEARSDDTKKHDVRNEIQADGGAGKVSPIVLFLIISLASVLFWILIHCCIKPKIDQEETPLISKHHTEDFLISVFS